MRCNVLGDWCIVVVMASSTNEYPDLVSIGVSVASRVRTMADLERLYQEERVAMVRLAHLLTGSVSLAEEVVQEAFISVYKNRGTVQQPGAYLRKSVINGSYGGARRRAVESQKLAIVAARPETNAVELPSEMDETWALLGQLKPRQRTALVLRYYEDQTVVAIAELMNEREGTVKSLIHRGLKALREGMTR
jgi:RNA polymerase sigma-70 factor (ECF subfamily)